MKYIDEFRDSALAKDLAAQIAHEAERPMQLMEVCGTHTMAIARFGIKTLLPPTIRLVSGPGCPVCVTPQRDIDHFLALGALPDVILTSFGDMLRVPGTSTTLEAARAAGSDVRVVYSSLDALSIAREHPDRRVVFCGVGFETTTPTVALAVEEAKRLGVTNFFVLCAHKIMPPALDALASDPETEIVGFICPGHVSAVLGSTVYDVVAEKYGIPCVITGFEPLDILQAILLLQRQAQQGQAKVEIQYSRIVHREGNPAALACIDRVFMPCDAEWRGLGVIPGSGLRFRSEYAAFDASTLSPAPAMNTSKPSVCECGKILKGQQRPSECRAFAVACTPTNPIGPCMVSSEGACAAAYRFERE